MSHDWQLQSLSEKQRFYLKLGPWLPSTVLLHFASTVEQNVWLVFLHWWAEFWGRRGLRMVQERLTGSEVDRARLWVRREEQIKKGKKMSENDKMHWRGIICSLLYFLTVYCNISWCISRGADSHAGIQSTIRGQHLLNHQRTVKNTDMTRRVLTDTKEIFNHIYIQTCKSSNFM